MVYFVEVCPDFPRPEDVNKFVSLNLSLSLGIKTTTCQFMGATIKSNSFITRVNKRKIWEADTSQISRNEIPSRLSIT